MKKLLGLLCVLVILSCSKETEDNYLVFGSFYGECLGEGCIEIYRLESNKLKEDTKDSYPNFNEFYIGDFESEKSIEDLALAQELWSFFPEELLDETKKVFGSPDAGDWGGLYIEYKNADKHSFWVLDQIKESCPEYTHEFHDKVNEILREISQ